MKKIICITSFILFTVCLPKVQVSAEELAPKINASGGQNTASLTDDNYNTSVTFSEGDTLTITSKDGKLISDVYIKWDSPVVPYTVDTDNDTLSCGTYGFLHEYIGLNSASASVTVHIPKDRTRICDIRIFDGDALPADVQVWNPPCDKADILLVSSHADDEILFLGGIIPTYGAQNGAAVQVVYMTEYWSGQRIREHEKLDGLWADGLRIYPVCGDFKDVYAENLKQAESLYDLSAITDYLTDTFRQFKPQVVVTHDFNGEYGHGFHQLVAKAVSLALDAAADENCRADSAVYENFGVWNVPKAYFHLYPENTIHMDLRIPLSSMNGMTALDVATQAYKQHVSQQWCWFYVSDTYQYSCADFGLYRTNVGYDTEDNMLENIMLYAKQEEQARLEQERLEEEERERLKQEEAKRLEQEKARQEALEEQNRLAQALQDATAQKESQRQMVLLILVICVAVIISPLLIRRLLRK